MSVAETAILNGVKKQAPTERTCSRRQTYLARRQLTRIRHQYTTCALDMWATVIVCVCAACSVDLLNAKNTFFDYSHRGDENLLV